MPVRWKRNCKPDQVTDLRCREFRRFLRPVSVFTDGKKFFLQGRVLGSHSWSRNAVNRCHCLHDLHAADRRTGQNGDEENLRDGSSKGDGKVETRTPTVSCTRAAWLVFCVSAIAVALFSRFVLHLKAHFQSYCLLNDGTLLQIDALGTARANNCCLRILLSKASVGIGFCAKCLLSVPLIQHKPLPIFVHMRRWILHISGDVFSNTF
ncbi:hypothetical protein TcWFU_002865 [Taenia crassiceps]|uniref:Uncharacterized protein n=1 Tax=Taenia crassiceps TaxID=6207 RepID=A0ABR4QK29_9CEST